MSSSTKNNILPETDFHGHRKFYDFEFVDATLNHLLLAKEDEAESESDVGKVSSNLISYIRENIIGSDYTFLGPFGLRKVLYCDYIASGKALTFIEDYIRDEVLPAYANTHTTTSVTGLQSTLFRHESRTIIRDCVNASEHDAVIFTGSGCTSAVDKLIISLNVKNDFEPPIVFAGPYDHHSTLLPWREITDDVHQVGMTEDGCFDMGEFHQLLKRFKGTNRRLIGCMSAASNVTGNVLPVDDITVCLHKAGALAFWDYAMAGPYVELDMNPYIGGDNQGYVYKDAMFVSPHKFVGGPGTPGLLIAKKFLFTNPVPAVCGGGTVFFVRREHHTYLKEIEVREEGGTPDIIGSIRAGLVFQLKRAVGVDAIVSREKTLYHKALTEWKNIPGLVILGNDSIERLPVFSLVFKLGNKLLHHNYAAALLDDLFGIQSRGGCACAGPYAEELLGIDERLAADLEKLLLEDSRLDRTHLRRTREFSDKEIMRPGFVRLNLPYFMNDEEINFVIEAVKMVATDGWKLLPRYLFNPTTGEWKVRHHEVFEDRKWLGAISYAGGKMNYSRTQHDKTQVPNYSETLRHAREIFKSATSSGSTSDQRVAFSDTNLLWFVVPSEASDLLANKIVLPFIEKPVFDPERFVSSITLPKESIEPSIEILGDAPTSGPCDLSLDSEQTACGDDESSEIVDEIPLEELSSTSKWQKIPKPIISLVIKAIEEYRMIRTGDKILVCLSGGKDSLSLLHTMKQYQYIAKSKGIEFSFGAVTVDPGSSAYDPRPLIPYLVELGVPYFYEEQGIMKQAGSLPDGCSSICSFCSRMKRGRIYKCARDNGYNVLALGQHLDDLTESFMMSVFHNGLLRTMKAHYTVSEGDLRVIRPLVYVREKALRDFAETRKLPIIPENCPACFEQPKERHRIKQLLASQEVMFPDLYKSLLTSLRPLMAISSHRLTMSKVITSQIDGHSPADDDWGD